MNISDYVRLEYVLPNASLENKEAALRAVAELAKKSTALSRVDEADLLQALQAREGLGSTGFGNGVAIPHCRLQNASDFVVGMITAPNGVDFDAIDGQKVKVVVFLVGPQRLPKKYIRLLSSISQAVRSQKTIAGFLKHHDPQSLLNAFLCHAAEAGPHEEGAAPAATREVEKPASEIEAASLAEKKKRMPPEWVAIKAFAAAIFVGTALLCLPISSASGKWTDALTALFTSTSAACVTGLTVVDTGSHFSRVGQIAVLVLIQLGGLGIMTLGTFLLVLVGRRLAMRDEIVLTDSLGSPRVRGLRSLIRRAVFLTLAIELAGATVLAYRLVKGHGYAVEKAAYHGIFHAISAFCNAGFALYSDSLAGFKTDKVMMLTVQALIVLGGVGFLVLYDLSSIRVWRRNLILRGRLSLHTRIVLKTTFALIALGFVLFLLLENTNTLALLRWPDKIVAALFHSVTPRTAGFSVVDMAAARPPTLYLTMALMFIGGSPGSTAGGVKTTTALILLISVVALVRGREETVVGGRIISMRVVRSALAIFMLGLFCVVLIFGLLLFTEHLPVSAAGTFFSSSEKLMFETISAFGTVGLSTGITSELSVFGKLCIILCMFVGRLGPLAIALVVGRKEFRTAVRYPEEEVMVG